MRGMLMALVVLAAALSFTGQAGATTAQIGGANAQPTAGCSTAGGETLVQATSSAAMPYAVPFAGVITSWSFVSAGTASPIKLKIFRPTAVPTDFTTVAESPTVTPAAETRTTFSANIRVAAGDLLGLRSNGTGTRCFVVSYDFDDLIRAMATTTDPAPGEPVSLTLGVDRARLTVGATVETDLDGDGLGDDTQDGDDDGDGAADGADNCPLAANPGQENADGDGQGDACDDDDDNDGLSDATEALLDRERPTVALGRLPAQVKRAGFMKGVRVRATPDEPVAFEFELLGSPRRATLARTFNLVLARRALGLAAGARGVRLKPNRRLVGSRRRFTVRLRVTATDASGNRAVLTRTLRVR